VPEYNNRSAIEVEGGEGPITGPIQQPFLFFLFLWSVSI